MQRLRKIRSYSEMSKMETLRERFEYLRLGGEVGAATFGSDRYLNQQFYHSPEWRRIRRDILLRDDGCELGLKGNPIHGRVYIHHINPISPDALEHSDASVWDPENLVCVSFAMHQAIHYGEADSVLTDPIVRRPNDTCPWKEAKRG